MTPLPDKLRAALRETADEIPAEAPPLRLSPARRVRHPRPRWPSWAAPLASDALSWTADGRYVAFVWGSTVRLLDTRAPGSDLLAGSRTVAVWTVGQSVQSMWGGAIITPDGRTVLGVEEIPATPSGIIRELLVTFATATGRQTAILDNLDALRLNGYEEVLYTNAAGSVLVVTYLRPGRNATILHDGRSTPIPWSPYIGIAAW
jgi:hypothetical protein